jgi:ComF family protein
MPATGPGRCANCAAAWDGRDFCPRCYHLRELAGIRAAFEHEGAARALVHRLKYQRYRALAPLIAAHVARVAATVPAEIWVPVALHRARERDRGFNQAELLLRHAGLPVAPVELRRTRNTGGQIGRSAAERMQALAGAFVCAGPPLEYASIGIIDDVITSGATVRDCARALLAHGAREVWAVSFTRASFDVASPTAPIPD